MYVSWNYGTPCWNQVRNLDREQASKAQIKDRELALAFHLECELARKGGQTLCASSLLLELSQNVITTQKRFV